MPTFGAINTPLQRFARVLPRAGFPVQNMGGIPQTPTTAPPKPFMTSPTVAPPPGPAPGAESARPQTGVRSAEVNPTPMPLPVPKPGSPPFPGPTPAPLPVPRPTTAPPVPPAPTATTPPPAPPPSAPPTTATSGQTGAAPPATQWNLESQLQNYLAGAFNSSVTPEFIQRAKGDVFRNVQGQTGQAINQINEDAIRRGLYRSGIPAQSISNVQGQAQGAMARGLADVLNAAEAQNIQGRQQAGSLATNLLGMNREQARYEQQRADEQAARAAAAAAAGRGNTFQYIDPDTGQVYELDSSWF